jgi:hypothetical protein
MAVKLIGESTRIWTYKASGIIPTALPSPQVEGWVRAQIGWSDTMLSWIKGTAVQEEELSDDEVQALMAEFQDRLKGH